MFIYSVGIKFWLLQLSCPLDYIRTRVKDKDSSMTKYFKKPSRRQTIVNVYMILYIWKGLKHDLHPTLNYKDIGCVIKDQMHE